MGIYVIAALVFCAAYLVVSHISEHRVAKGKKQLYIKHINEYLSKESK